MVNLLLAGVFIACVIAITLIGNPHHWQVDPVVGHKLQRWRRALFAVEILAGMILVWELGGA